MKSGEGDRLKRIIAPMLAGPRIDLRLSTGAVRELLGIQAADDAALLRVTGDIDLVVASDYVRGTEFLLFETGHLSLHDLGYYLVVANLSDIAAMGADPIGLLTVLRYPTEMTDDELRQVVAGVKEAADDHRTTVLGGDTGSAERLILAASALGAVSPGLALRRTGARVGDGVWVTVPVGLAISALVHQSDRERTLLDPAEEGALLAAWRRPRAQTVLGRWLANERLATACTDVSDGLLAALRSLAEASKVGIEVEAEALPVLRTVEKIALAHGIDPLILAVSSSVDFALLFTASPEKEPRLAGAPVEMARIGTVTPGEGVQLAVEGRPRPIVGIAWDHTVEVDQLADRMRGLTGPRLA